MKIDVRTYENTIMFHEQKKNRCKVCYERNNVARTWRVSQNPLCGKLLLSHNTSFFHKTLQIRVDSNGMCGEIARAKMARNSQIRKSKNKIGSQMSGPRRQSGYPKPHFFTWSFQSMSTIKALTQGQRVRSVIRD